MRKLLLHVPSYTAGVQSFGEMFAYVTGFIPIIEVVSFDRAC